MFRSQKADASGGRLTRATALLSEPAGEAPRRECRHKRPKGTLVRTLWIHTRRLTIGIVGFTVLGLGLLLFITPIPVGWFLVPAGLILLAAEFEFARRWLAWADERVEIRRRYRQSKGWLARQFGLARAE